jgi:hypothetical protein
LIVLERIYTALGELIWLLRIMIQVFSDDELRKLLKETGYILNIDFPTRTATIHETACQHADPDAPSGVKPSRKVKKKTGEFWYSKSQDELLQKMEESPTVRRYRIIHCAVCNP